MEKMAFIISKLNFVLSIIGCCSALFQLSGYPSTIVVGDNVTIVLTCSANDSNQYVTWRQLNISKFIRMAEVRDNCSVDTGDNFNTDNGYHYYCDLVLKEYVLKITIYNISEENGNTTWKCTPLYGDPSNSWSPSKVLVPVTNVEITPVGSNRTVSIKANDSLTFTCTTDSGRPAAWIQWYIGGENMTNQASSVITSDDTKFITSSTLNYTGNNADHSKAVYCDAINIGGRQKIKTDDITIFVLLSVTKVSLTPVGINSVVSIAEEYSLVFTCTTDSSRPAARIEWYIGAANMTDQAISMITVDGNMFITSSTLNYTGKDADHEKTIYCVAINTDDRLKIQSEVITAYIEVPVTHLTIVPNGNENVQITKEETIQFSCTTNLGRPAAWIQWYIGDKNVTNEASAMITQNGSKFISVSTLNYTAKESDHDNDVYCEAVSLEGLEKVKSISKKIYIRSPIEFVTISTLESSNNVSVVTGELYVFTCTTSSGRPAAWIQWYIGLQNVTDQATRVITQESTKFISSSTLNYTGKDADNNNVVYCDAINIANQPKVTSFRKTLSIKVPVSVVTITPNGIKDKIYIKINDTQTCTCATDLSRPAALIQWFLGGKNITNLSYTKITLNGSKFSSSSTLNYTGIDSDHNDIIRCRAINIEGRLIDSRNKTLYIQHPVQSAFIMPVGDNNTISAILEKPQIFTCTTDSSRPAAWIYWYIGDRNVTHQSTSMEIPEGTKFISTSTLNYTLNDTDHDNVVYCEAINIERSKAAKSMKKTLYVIVPISRVTLLPTFGNKSVTVTSEVDFNFTCITSVSRPGARIEWYIGSQDVTNTAISIITQEGSKFISSSNLNYTGNIADHDKSIRCEAVNSNDHTISQTESLHVRSRTTNDETYDLRTEVFIGTNEGLNLTVHLIANPKPDITWTFDSNLQLNQTIIIPDFNITSVDIFRHVTEYVKNSVVQSDFGNYTVKAGNGIDSYFVHVFAVKPAQAPSSPFSLDAVCNQQFPFINVSWLSNFNGGSKQNFFVVVRNMITNVMVNSSAQRDRGQNIIHSYENTYAYDSVYAIYVEAYNKHGGANSSDVVNCTTSKEIPQSLGSSLAVIGGAAGFGTALIVVAVIGLVVFIHRRKKYKGDEKDHLHRLNGRTQEMDENEEDGLKDNPLYGTSGTSVTAVEYIPVQKPSMGKTSLTAESQDKNPKMKKGKQTEIMELACVYENADDLRKDEPKNIYGNVNEDGQSTMVLPSNDRKTKQNKDGLIYADLAFAFSDSGKTFVIRGLENRTNYAMIDLTKRAEPLPPDSDDDDTINAG